MVNNTNLVGKIIRKCELYYFSILYTDSLDKAIQQKRWAKAIRICKRILSEQIKINKKYCQDDFIHGNAYYYYTKVCDEITERTCKTCNKIGRIMENKESSTKCHKCDRFRKFCCIYPLKKTE